MPYARAACLLLVLLYCLLPAPLAAEADGISAVDPASVRFRRLDQAEGLSQSSVLALAQDRHGFVWMGTQDGLNRFDGFDIRVFRPQRGRADALSNNWVGALALDHEGQLWVGTQAGLNRFDAASERFTIYRHDPQDPGSIAGDSVHALHVDDEGRLWVGGNGGLAAWSPAQQRFERIPLPPPPAQPASMPRVEDARVRALASGADGSLWVGTVRGLLRFDRRKHAFARLPEGGEGLAESPINALRVDGDELWVGSEDLGLGRLSFAEGRWQRWRHDPEDAGSLGNDKIYSLLIAADGGLWIGHEAGADRLDRESGHLQRFRHDHQGDHSIGRGRVTSLLQDHRGTLWLGSWEGGASRLDPGNNRFVAYTPYVATTAALRQPGIAALAADGDSLWLGGADGLYRFWPAQRRLLALSHATRSFIYGIDLDADGLWLGTRDGLLRFDREGRSLPLQLPAPLDRARTRRFLRDGDLLWLAADTLGLYLLGEGGRQIKAFHPIAGVVTFIRALDDRYVLVGAHDGLYWFERNSGRLRHRHSVHNEGGADQLPAAPSDLLHARDGQLWLTTYGSGLMHIDHANGGEPASARFTQFGREQGLAAEGLNGLLEDANGRLWMSANGYIARFDPERERFRSFDLADGALPRYWIGAEAKLDDGRLAFAGPDGLTLFDPAAIGPQPAPPAPLITALELDNRPADLRSVDPKSPLQAPPYLAGRIDLPPAHARTLGLRFTAPEYIAPEQARFAYRLDGFDRDWVEDLQQRRFATYTNLPHGEYRFRVRLRNGDGEWSQEEARLVLHVAPFWWQTWWAAVGFVLLGALLISGGFLLRLRQLAGQQQRLQQEVETRTGELRQAMQKLSVNERLAAIGQLTAGVAHEINSPASFVQVASQNLQHQLREFHALLMELGGDDLDEEVADTLHGRFAALDEQLGNVLDGSRRIHRIVQDLRVFSVPDESERKPIPVDEPLRAALHLLRARLGADIELDEDFAVTPLVRANPAQLSQAFYSLIQNACQAIAQRSGPGFHGRLRVATRLQDESVQVDIADNGGGIPDEALPRIFEPFFTTRSDGQSSGLGLTVAASIVADHGGRIEVDNRVGEGCCFRVLLPV